MEHKAQTITFIDGPSSTREVTAFVGVGTGLAYAEFDNGTFCIIHVSSGYPLPLTVTSTDEAKKYLENLVGIFKDQWNCDLTAFNKRFKRHGTVINRRVRAAYEASLSLPGDEVFLYAATDSDIFTESNTDAFNNNPMNGENRRIVSELLSDYPEASKVVMVRMDDSGDHHEIKTFQREATAATA